MREKGEKGGPREPKNMRQSIGNLEQFEWDSFLSDHDHYDVFTVNICAALFKEILTYIEPHHHRDNVNSTDNYTLALRAQLKARALGLVRYPCALRPCQQSATTAKD